MNLPPLLPLTGQANLWKDLIHSVPTLAALAQLASDRLVVSAPADYELSPEARTILSITRNRGVIELKSNNTEFESSQRMLLFMLNGQQNLTLCFAVARNQKLLFDF